MMQKTLMKEYRIRKMNVQTKIWVSAVGSTDVVLYKFILSILCFY